MEEDRESTRYWCHECNLEVDPILEVESVKCSLCHGGFMEEMDSLRGDHRQETGGSDPDLESDHALSLWAPILLGMMNNPHRRGRRQRFRQPEFDMDEDRHEDRHRRHHEEAELERELDSFMRRRRRSSATIRHLHGEQERVVLVNPFNQTIIIQGSGEGGGDGSSGDYLVGPGLDQLLQHLAENDPSRYGTPPAQKEAVESMPTVTVNETSVQCSVCLDDFEVKPEAKEMPCKHIFHSECILPWLELHSSCPVCRFELPADESKVNQDQGGLRGSVVSRSEPEGVGNVENGRRFSVSLPWPFNSLFSSSGSRTSGLMTSASGSGSSPWAGEDEE